MISLKSIAVAGLACLVLAGCKFVPTAEKQTKASVNSAQAPDKAFDAKVAELWDAKVIPYASAKAGALPDVLAAIKTDADAAGAEFGYKEKGGSSPFTFLARIEGKVVEGNTQSRAATLDVDADGDDKADARVQIGPVIRGTAIRDSLDFVNFNDFTNQIDFAQFGKAFNTHVNSGTLEKLPRDSLLGKTVLVLGAFPLPQGSELPLVTPITIEIRP
jgi:predicted lipoprotein